MTPTTFKYEVSPRGVATLTLDRPDRLNAFNQQMLGELLAQIATIARNEKVRVLVLRAAGKHFSSGADMERPSGGENEVRHASFVDLFEALDQLGKPTIAVVQGACVGGAAAVAASCDVVIAADSAFFSIPEVRIGVAPIGVTPILVRAMGLRNYRRYALSGERIPAREAQRLGLADEVYASDAIDARVTELGDAFLHGAPGALATLKAHLQHAYPQTKTDLTAAKAHHAKVDSFKSPEALEGVAAFKAKRKPSWYPPG